MGLVEIAANTVFLLSLPPQAISDCLSCTKFTVNLDSNAQQEKKEETTTTCWKKMNKSLKKESSTLKKDVEVIKNIKKENSDDEELVEIPLDDDIVNNQPFPPLPPSPQCKSQK